MEYFPAPLEQLVEQFARLPGIGSKSAQRLAFYVLGLPLEEAEEFADAILNAKKRKRRSCPISTFCICKVAQKPEVPSFIFNRRKFLLNS